MNVCANKLVGLSQARVQHAIDTYGHLATFQVQSLSLSFSFFLFLSLSSVLSVSFSLFFSLSLSWTSLSLSLSLSLSTYSLFTYIPHASVLCITYTCISSMIINAPGC